MSTQQVCLCNECALARLNVENERLTIARDNWEMVCEGALKEQFRLRAEVERLRARNADLEEQILRALGERALEPKP